MTDDDKDPKPEQDDAMRSLLKRSLAPEGPRRPVLSEVQRKIRQRSKGKFYADGWSTTRSRFNYGLIAGVMLLIVAVAYVVLGPMGITSK
jgi:hypothetical protein